MSAVPLIQWQQKEIKKKQQTNKQTNNYTNTHTLEAMLGPVCPELAHCFF